MLQDDMDELRRQEPDSLAAFPHIPNCPSTSQSPVSRLSTATQCSSHPSLLTIDNDFLTDQTPRSAAHNRVSLLVQSSQSSSPIPSNSNINLRDLTLVLSTASSNSPSSSNSSSPRSSLITSSMMGSTSVIDLSSVNNTAVVGPLSLGKKLYQSDQVFGLSPPPSAHPYSHRFSSARAPDQDAFSYRKIGPAIVLKSYQPKNSSLDSAYSASSNLEESAQPDDFDNYSLRAPFTYTADSIYAELGLAEPNHYNPVDGEQMTPLHQFDQDSLDTQVEQSYRTAVTTTSGPPLPRTDDIFQSCDFQTTDSTNQTQLTDQLDLLSDDPLTAPSDPQPQTNSSVELIPPILLEKPCGTSEPLLPDCAMETATPKEIAAPEPYKPSSCLSNTPTAPSEEVSSLRPLAEMQHSLPSEAPGENSLKISVPMESHVDEKHTRPVSKLIVVLNEASDDLTADLSRVEEGKPPAVNSNETSQNDSIQLIGTCPINPQSRLASKSDDQVTIKSNVIQLSRPTPTAKLSASQFSPEKGAENLTLNKPNRPSKPSIAVNNLYAKVHAPSVDNIPGKTASDPPLIATADQKDKPIVLSLSPEIIRQGDLNTSCAVTDFSSCNLGIGTGEPVDPIILSEPSGIAQAAPVVQCENSPAINKDDVSTAPGKQRVSINTLSESAKPTIEYANTSSEVAKPTTIEDIPASGKDTSVTIDNEPSNEGTEKAQMLTSMSSKQASRMRSISGFFKTLNKKQNIKTEVLNSPGSASIKSSEEEISPQSIKALPKRKSLSSLKVKARFSSFYRATDEPVPTIPQALEPPRISEEKEREAVAVEGKTAPLRKCETRPPSTPKTREQPPTRAARATSQFISAAEVRVTKIAQQYKISHAKRGLRSRSQTIIPPSASPIDNLDNKPFGSVVGELGSAQFPRPKTLRKKRTFNTQVSTPVLKDITLSGLISKLMRKNSQKADSTA